MSVVAPRYATETSNLPDARFVVDTPKEAHNTYLGIFAELGVVGLLAFGVVVLLALVVAWRATKAFAHAREAPRSLSSSAGRFSSVSWGC